MRRGILSNTSTPVKVVTLLGALLTGVFVAIITTSLLLSLLAGVNPEADLTRSPTVLRIIQTISALLLFILPSGLTAWLISPRPLELLSLDRSPSPRAFLYIAGCAICLLPFISWIEELNRAIVFPPSLQGVESWFLAKESDAQRAIELITKGSSLNDIVSSFFVVALLAGVSEELLFRGFIQNMMERSSINRHLAVWITAFIFSAIHIQFYGFIPRLLLGGYLGYLLVWSRSLWIPMAAHTLNNGIYLFFQFANRKEWIEFDPETFSFTDQPLLLGLSIPAALLMLWLTSRALQKQNLAAGNSSPDS